MSEATTKRYTKPPTLPDYGSLSTIVKEIKPGEKILDVGCSEGYLATYLPENKVWGIDGNVEALKIAKEHCVDAKEMDLNNVPTSPVFHEQFDVIVYADVLEHLLYPEDILKHFKQYLRPGGKVIISLPNIALWRVRLNLLFGRFDYTDYGVMDRTHLHLYTFKTAKELVQKAGFTPVKEMGAANLLGPIVHFIPFLKSLLGIHVIIIAENR